MKYVFTLMAFTRNFFKKIPNTMDLLGLRTFFKNNNFLLRINKNYKRICYSLSSTLRPLMQWSASYGKEQTLNIFLLRIRQLKFEMLRSIHCEVGFVLMKLITSIDMITFFFFQLSIEHGIYLK